MLGTEWEKFIAGGFLVGAGLVVVGMRIGVLRGFPIILLGIVILGASVGIGIVIAKGWAPGASPKHLTGVKLQHKFAVDKEGREVLLAELWDDPTTTLMAKVVLAGNRPAELVAPRQVFNTLVEGESYNLLVKGNKILQAAHLPRR